MKSIDQILWPKGSSDIEDAERYAKEWRSEYEAGKIKADLDGPYEPSSLDLKRAAKEDAKRSRK